MVLELTKANPAIAKIVGSPEALQKIFSSQLLQQVQSGHPDESAIDEILSVANVSSLPEGLELMEMRAGDGKTFPKVGNEVVVEYKGRLKDGRLFDSGVFSFHVGSSEAIQGWDIGVRRMSLGERAVLQVPAALGYGSVGAGSIPPNADLVFEVSLREIKQ